MCQQLNIPLFSIQYQWFRHDAAVPDVDLVHRRLDARVREDLAQVGRSKLGQPDPGDLARFVQALHRAVRPHPLAHLFFWRGPFVVGVERDAREGDYQEVDVRYPEFVTDEADGVLGVLAAGGWGDVGEVE